MAARPILVIAGPTGAGKSSLAIDLAQLGGFEVVSADSQQVYRGMDIGTGKVTASDRACVPHHLIDVVEPDEDMSAARYAQMADTAIADIQSRGSATIVVGGTGLYIRALLLGFFEGPPGDRDVRLRLDHRADVDGVEGLWNDLLNIDAECANRIHPADRRRIIRALEVFELTGVPMSEHQRRHDHRSAAPRYRHRYVVLAPRRERLYEAIERRVDDMMQQGWVDEVAALRARGFRPPLRSQAAIGYHEIHDHLDGQCRLDDAVALIKRNSRRYARRQLSWLRRDPGESGALWTSSASEVDLPELRRYLAGP